MDWRGPDLAAQAEAQAERTRPCPCGVVDVAPWRDHDLPWSPASLIFGLAVLALAVVAMVAAEVLWIGPVILAVWVVATVATFVLARRRGHRRWCLTRRGFWMGVAALGVPVRILAGLPS